MVPRRDSDSPGYRIGLGWHIDMNDNVWLHSGQTGGYSSSLSVDPENEQIVVLLANTATDLVPALARRLRSLMRGGTVDLLDLPPILSLGEAELDRYVGRFASQFLGLAITRKGDRLFAQFTEPEPLPLSPTSKHTFFYKTVDARLVFEEDDAGRMSSVTLHQHGKQFRLLRMMSEP